MPAVVPLSTKRRKSEKREPAVGVALRPIISSSPSWSTSAVRIMRTSPKMFSEKSMVSRVGKYGEVL